LFFRAVWSPAITPATDPRENGSLRSQAARRRRCAGSLNLQRRGGVLVLGVVTADPGRVGRVRAAAGNHGGVAVVSSDEFATLLLIRYAPG